MTTLSGIHAIAGAVALSSLGSALAIAMMVGGGARGAPPLAALLAWSRLDPRTGSGTVLIGSKPLSTLNAQPPELKHCVIARLEGASVL
jgi:hypothetical protein